MTVGTQWHQICSRIHVSLVLGDRVDVVNMNVAACVLSSVDFIEVKPADYTCRAMYIYGLPTILWVSLILLVSE